MGHPTAELADIDGHDWAYRRLARRNGQTGQAV